MKLSHCLWFDGRAEEAAKFYTSIFKDGRIGRIARYPDAGFEQHHQPAGSVMTVEFEIGGEKYLGLNGGPLFQFNEAFSIVVSCDDQRELDFYWSRLTEGGGRESQCGWLQDKFGVRWQIVPAILPELMTDPDAQKRGRVFSALMQMGKLDLAALQRAYDGK